MKKLLTLLLFIFPIAIMAQNKIVIKASQVTVNSLAPIAADNLVANNTGSPASPTAVPLAIGLKFYHGVGLGIDTANFKDTIYALNGLQILGTGFNRIGLGGFLSQNTTISGSNAFAFTLDSMQAATGRGFRVNFGSDAGWDLHTRDSATGFWTRIAKGTPGQALTMLSTGGIGWAAGGGTTSYQVQTAAGGITTFTFTSVPVSFNDYMIIRNGVVLLPTTDYTTVGNVVTIPSVINGDKIVFREIK